MKEFIYIERNSQLTKFLKYLSENRIDKLAFDFELESNLHVYGQKICLIQIFDGNSFFIIDPFKISRDKLAELLENKKILKLFFAADSDLSFAFQQYNIKVKSVFDLQIMVDLLQFKKKGLDTVLLYVLGVVHRNKRKYQKFNWTVRPIREDAIEYALSDVEHLFALNDKLRDMISAAGLDTELLYSVIKRRNEFDGKTVPAPFRSPEYCSLDTASKKYFKKIYTIRDRFARKINCPPDCVLTKKQMAELVGNRHAIRNIVFSRRVPMRYHHLIRDALDTIR